MKKRRRRRHDLNRRLPALMIAALALLAVLAVGFLALRAESRERVQTRGVETQKVGVLERVEFDGRTYVKKPSVTTVLLMGIDRNADDARYGARQGGQADFLLLLCVDHESREIRQLHIDRDTMSEVETLGVLGNATGVKTMQICLAHAFGVTEEESCEHMRNAAENLLGVQIDYYLSLNFDAISVLNDALGGVTVTLEEDFTAVDPAMKPGATLTLTGDQARTMMRSRMEIEDGTNASRMKRQQAFLSAAAQQMAGRIKSDSTFIQKLFDSLQDYVCTDMPQVRMLAEMNQAYHYVVLPADTLAGEHTIGNDGFTEFHVRDGEAARWVMKTLFNREEENQ